MDKITSTINGVVMNFGIKRYKTVKDSGNINAMFLTIIFSLEPSDKAWNMLIKSFIIQIFISDGAKIRKIIHGTSKDEQIFISDVVISADGVPFKNKILLSWQRKN